MLAQLKQRHRQLDDETRRDRERMFQISRDQTREGDQGRRMAMTQEIFRLQTQMSQRSRDQAELAAEIARVTKDATPKGESGVATGATR